MDGDGGWASHHIRSGVGSPRVGGPNGDGELDNI